MFGKSRGACQVSCCECKQFTHNKGLHTCQVCLHGARHHAVIRTEKEEETIRVRKPQVSLFDFEQQLSCALVKVFLMQTMLIDLLLFDLVQGVREHLGVVV